MSNQTGKGTVFVGYTLNDSALYVFTIIGSLEVFSGVFGNYLLLTALLKRASLRLSNVHNLLVANLALADLLTLGYWMTFFVFDLLLGYHPVASDVHCAFNGCLIVMLTVVSVLSLMSISMNRYLHVCHPHLFLRFVSLRRTVICCVLCWIIGLLLTVPSIAGFGNFGYNPASHICSIATGEYGSYSYVRVTILCFLTFPMCLVGYWNFAIFRHWKKTRMIKGRCPPIQTLNPPVNNSHKSNNGSMNSDHLAKLTPLGNLLNGIIVEHKLLQLEQTAEQALFQSEQTAEQELLQSERTAEKELLQPEKTAEKELLQSERTAEQELLHSEQTAEQELFHSEQTAEKELIQSERTDEQELLQAEKTANKELIQPEQSTKKELIQSEQTGKKELLQSEQTAEQELLQSEQIAEQEFLHSEHTAEQEEHNIKKHVHPELKSLVLRNVSQTESATAIIEGIRQSRSCNSLQEEASSHMQHLQQLEGKKKKREKDFVRSLFVVFIFMFGTFIPFFLINAISPKYPVPIEVTIAGNLILYLNSAVNWIVYGAMHPCFRREYVKSLDHLGDICRQCGSKSRRKIIDATFSSISKVSSRRREERNMVDCKVNISVSDRRKLNLNCRF